MATTHPFYRNTLVKTSNGTCGCVDVLANSTRFRVFYFGWLAVALVIRVIGSSCATFVWKGCLGEADTVGEVQSGVEDAGAPRNKLIRK